MFRKKQYSGFGDEAGSSLEAQIQATIQLGWENIELRRVAGRLIHEFTMDEIATIAETLADAGIAVSGIGSKIADWSRDVSDPIDVDLDEAEQLIPRMHLLGAKSIRIMSYRPRGGWFEADQQVDTRIERLKKITARFLDNGIQPLHENCNNYGGISWQETLTLVTKIPGLRLAFDTANPANTPVVGRGDWIKRQSPYEFYINVREFIDTIHIKDSIWKGPPEKDSIFPVYQHCFPGEGEAQIPKIAQHLVSSNFTGVIAIEPHMVRGTSPPAGYESMEAAMLANYIEYGRRTEKIFGSV